MRLYIAHDGDEDEIDDRGRDRRQHNRIRLEEMTLGVQNTDENDTVHRDREHKRDHEHDLQK